MNGSANPNEPDPAFPDTISGVIKSNPLAMDLDQPHQETKEGNGVKGIQPESDLVIDNSAILCKHHSLNPFSKDLKRVRLVNKFMS